MRRVLVVLLSTVLVAGLGVGPAHADHAATLHAILNCVKGGTADCGQTFTGINSTIQITNPSLGWLDGHSVVSLYYIVPGGRVGYRSPTDPCDNCDWIEYGWDQTRGLTYNDRLLFFLAVVNGVTVLDQTKPVPSSGTYEFSLYHVDATDRWQPSYKNVAGGSWVSPFAAYYNLSFAAGQGSFRMAVETNNQSAGGYDRVGTAWHKNTRIRLSNYAWVAANFYNGTQTKTTLDTMDCYANSWSGGSGSTGDTNSFVPTC